MTKQICSELIISGDKSISHRALILASQTIGKTIIKNLSTGDDVKRTMTALKQLGIKIKTWKDGIVEVSGVGIGGLTKPDDILNMGNSGTAARLFTGLISTYPFNTIITGDKSLRNRPMEHIIEALHHMCVDFIGKKLPLIILGSPDTIPIEYELLFNSAQLKSAILLAALNTQGMTTIIENYPFSRDHTEIMLKYFKARITIKESNSYKKITLEGQSELFSPGYIQIPSDPSTAAFFIAAALIIPDSNIIIKNVCINPTRIGFYKIIKKMGANISFENESLVTGEKVADIKAEYSNTLYSTEIHLYEVLSAIDEIPILSIIAAYSKGITTINGLDQLRFKESNRINSIVENLQACGIQANAKQDNIIIKGTGEVKGGCKIKTYNDHRIAMSFIICSLASKQKINIDNISSITTSFPQFLDTLKTFSNYSKY